MRLLVILLILFAVPFPVLANGAPCGSPPKLDNAEAARAVSAAVQADLGAAPVETPFLQTARESVDALAEKYGLSRGDVVARYVFHICEALYARGTEGEALSQVLSRVEEALDAPAPADKAATEAPAGGAAATDEPKTTASAQPQSSGPTADPDSAPAVTKSLESKEQKREAAPQRTVRRFQYRAAPKPPQNNLGINQFGTAQNQNSMVRRNAPGAGNTAAPRTMMRRAAPEAGTTDRDAPASAPSASEPPAPADTTPEPAAEQALVAPQAAEAPDPEAEAADAPEPAEPPSQTGETAAPAEPAGPGVTGAAEPSEETAAQPASRAPDAPADSEAALAAPDRAPAALDRAPASRTATTATAPAEPEAVRAANDAGACPERGVLGAECFDVDAALERLRDRPVEYNHPPEMIRGQATEITLVLRTDFTEDGLPEETSEAFERLQGEVKQQRAKISNIMSARLRGRDFEVDPNGMQERTITWRRPVAWSWYVTPKAGGENKRLELELYAHIVNPQGETQPPVLIKTLDATIDVDVRTLDWLIEQARTFEPIYAIVAAIIGFFTALITLWLRRRPAHSGDGPPSGITTASAPPDRRISDMSASEAAAAAARKGQDADDNGKGRG